MMKQFSTFIAFLSLSISLSAQFTKEISFEDFGLDQDTFWHCKSECDNFEVIPFEFESKYDSSWGGFWSGGFALSTMRDDTTEGFTNLFSAISGKAMDGFTYIVGQNNASIKSKDYYAAGINKISITNTTYAYWSMRNGDSFAKKFGGTTGKDPDYFKIRMYATISNIPVLIDENISEDYRDFYLADFRDTNNTNDYIIDDWVELNIDSLFGFHVGSLKFEIMSSDTSQFGINTPTFFALDRLKYDVYLPTFDMPEESVEIYPSITSDEFTLKTNNLNIKMIEIFDSFGNSVYDSKLIKDNSINVNHLNPGIYFVKAFNEKGSITKKLIKI